LTVGGSRGSSGLLLGNEGLLLLLFGEKCLLLLLGEERLLLWMQREGRQRRTSPPGHI
jgi:hypothetical protein